jgi:hypothetical protein
LECNAESWRLNASRHDMAKLTLIKYRIVGHASTDNARLFFPGEGKIFISLNVLVDGFEYDY